MCCNSQSFHFSQFSLYFRLSSEVGRVKLRSPTISLRQNPLFPGSLVSTSWISCNCSLILNGLQTHSKVEQVFILSKQFYYDKFALPCSLAPALLRHALIWLFRPNLASNSSTFLHCVPSPLNNLNITYANIQFVNILTKNL